MGSVVWLHKTGRAARQAGCRSERQCTDAGAPSSNREAVGGEGVGWEEGEYYAADWAEAVAARGLEGWKAGRLEGFSKGTTRAFGAVRMGDLSRIPREGRRTKIQQKGPWVFWGDGSVH